MENAYGKVWLIGAGPGDLELLTLKAVRVLASADVLIVDALVDPEIASFAPRARVVTTGKRAGCRSAPQDFIQRLMRRYARQGKTVARVKGGDPLMFGRAGEEIAYLFDNGIEVEVVNGVTSALAAAASLTVSLTHRDFGASGVTFVTAHRQDHSAPDWATLAAAGTTLAIYMGLGRACEVADGLLAALPASTPAAVVACASTRAERRLVTTLGQLADDCRAAKMPAPALILVGAALESAVGDSLPAARAVA
ncbi:uroporphyrinogen-III C-methyltransferase [Crenobacter cavernae]|uniref:uroporphyrinogen-III C-methyltransferase n=1 Tax=Crenobacter cavernae TaxID=2290923 RepID=A0ABY0FGQ5_9NEIS|nr:uroporphyrinogen-III C-methyltransferase [Crenobacter cavernae]RXZ45575.1 uroporphyrinogen-III C-methyltransferase [Crenobacter cavernae]